MGPVGAFEPGMRRIALTAVAVTMLAGMLSSAAGAATRWSLRGAGWGHGIGMSQYGAYGFAKHGSGYRDILRHYYAGTAIATRDGGTVRVLLAPNKSVVMFRSAGTAGGRNLSPDSTYKATRDGSTVVLRGQVTTMTSASWGIERPQGSRPSCDRRGHQGLRVGRSDRAEGQRLKPLSRRRHARRCPSLATQPVQHRRVHLAGIAMAEIVELAVGHIGARCRQHLMRLPRHLHREHPVEPAVHEIDRQAP